jgi:Na+/H+-dicarboxylate symporter
MKTKKPYVYIAIGVGIGIFIGWFFNKSLTQVAFDFHAPRPANGGL